MKLYYIKQNQIENIIEILDDMRQLIQNFKDEVLDFVKVQEIKEK